MISSIKLFLFFISNIGFWELLRRNSKINLHFLPSLTIALQTTILFISGLLNLLFEATILLYGIGLLSFLYFIYKDKGVKFISNYFNIGFFFLGTTLIIMLLFLKGKVFIDYDNFSHWALVVRQLLETNRFPNFEDTLIIFQEYPLGSASYIYYFSKLISPSESIQMLAQVYMMLTCIIPLLIFCKKNKVATFISLFVITNFILVYNTSTTSLLVDTLLPLAAMCALIYSYFYCLKCDGKFEFYSIIFYLIQLMQIKNSGIFFVLIIGYLILIYIRNDKNILQRVFCLIMPFFSFLLWQKHCSYVFPNANTSKHAMTAANYHQVFSEKTLEDIQTICSSMIKFLFTWKDIWLAIAIIGFIGILIFIWGKCERNTFFKIAKFSLGMYLVYQIGVLGMYIFSMPGNEATSLAGITRYTKTILIAIIYLVMISVIQLLSDINLKKMSTALVTFFIIIGVTIYQYSSLGSIHLAVQPTENPETRTWIETVKKDYKIPEGESYCILIPELDAGYSRHLSKYIFRSNFTTSLVVTTEEDLNKIEAKYILVYDQENDTIDKWIQKNYPDQYKNPVIIKENVET